MPLSLLLNINTGEFFSEEHGWNTKEASLRTDWSRIIYQHKGGIGRHLHLDWRDIDSSSLLCINMPQLPEILT